MSRSGRRVEASPAAPFWVALYGSEGIGTRDLGGSTVFLTVAKP
jgi:hypothetical protein